MTRLVLDRLSKLIEYGYTITAYCETCGHSAELDLVAIMVARGDLPLHRLRKVRCRACGARGTTRLSPP
ncbi:MAG: hypothetical protein AB7O57_19490, partial [Hyphomicrobiaceae bacterium]